MHGQYPGLEIVQESVAVCSIFLHSFPHQKAAGPTSKHSTRERYYRKYTNSRTQVNDEGSSNYISYSQKQLYSLIANVDSYHHFVPYCTASRVLSSRTLRLSDVPGFPPVERKEAELTVGFLAFKESYVSEVTCTPYLSVEVRCCSASIWVDRDAEFNT